MSASYQELATVASKEIFLKIMDSPNLTHTEPGKALIFRGVDLVNHLGDCYQALYKKVYASLKEA